MTPAAKITKLYANGDSFTHGHGLRKQEKTVQWGADPDDYVHALANSWPSLLARDLGYSYVNQAVPGGSNDRIVRTTIDYVCKNDTADLLVIIGWAHTLRKEVHCIDHPWTNTYNPNEKNTRYRKLMLGVNSMWDIPGADQWVEEQKRYGWDDVESHVRYFNQVLLLSSFLKVHNVPFLFFNAHIDPKNWTMSANRDAYELEMTKHLCQNIDWNMFLALNDDVDSVLCRLCMQAGQILPDGFHPTQQGHQLIADEINKELRKREII